MSCVDYITAGVDTVGNSLIYAIWLISNSDHVQKRLREELESIGKQKNLFKTIIFRLLFLTSYIVLLLLKKQLLLDPVFFFAMANN